MKEFMTKKLRGRKKAPPQGKIWLKEVFIVESYSITIIQ